MAMKLEEISNSNLYFAHEQWSSGMAQFLAVSEFVQPRDGETVERKRIRFAQWVMLRLQERSSQSERHV